MPGLCWHFILGDETEAMTCGSLSPNLLTLAVAPLRVCDMVGMFSNSDSTCGGARFWLAIIAVRL